MKVILLTDVKKVGRKGEIKDVADGYAQNVLLPKKLVLPGTPENVKRVEKEQELKKDAKAFTHTLLAKTLKDLHEKTVVISAKANDAGTLFEAIHKKQIIDAVKKECGAAIVESVIHLESPIKKAGTHVVQLEGEGEKVSVTLKVG